MKVMWKAACVAILLIAATSIEIGCGQTYRPVVTPLPATTGNPSGFETEVVLSCCLDPNASNSVSHVRSSVITDIDVSGDTNVGNKVLANVANSLAFDGTRTTVFTTNPATPATPNSVALPDSVTQVLLASSTAGFSALTTTISLEAGSAPSGVSFQYFGPTYKQDYVVNSGTNTATCPGTGSITAIAQATSQVVATVCVGPSPVLAWIYKDQTKVFVPDSNGTVYVISAATFKVTNTIALNAGAVPIKVAQSANGDYIYVLSTKSHSNQGSISIIDGSVESLVSTITTDNPLSTSANPLALSTPIDVAQDLNFNDTTNSTQVNHVWVLQADGTVSVYDGSAPGQLSWITSLATTSTVSAGALPTNLALMRDGTQAYVGVAGSDKIIAINTAKLASNAVTSNASTAITVGVHRSISQAINDTTGAPHSVLVETTTPTVSYVAVSRGTSADLSKAYAATTTNTTYYYYDANVNPTTTLPSPTPATCTDNGANQVSCPNLYNGTAVVYAVGNGTVPINTYVTTIPAPDVVTYCDANNLTPGQYDGAKNCPLMVPQLILGRS
jgi:hypothetical protein